MKKYSVSLLILGLLFSGCVSEKLPQKPEDMPDVQYEKYIELIKSTRQTIKETKDAFPTQAYLDMGLYSQILQDYAAAEDAYNAVLEVVPTNNLALNNLAVVKEEQGKDEEALLLYGRLIDAAPTSYEAMNDLVRLFKKTGRVQDGRKTLENFIKNFPQEKKNDAFLKFVSDMFISLNEK
ncbi:tetratricopeptide repeat protein [Candidatus Peregrinibacteria bacterium]|nr:tetratricopeptide repeat protein [Candidatus Peregrinibacteria bacterium]